MRPARQLLPLLAIAVVTACSDAPADSATLPPGVTTPITPREPTAPSPTPTVVGYPGIAAALTINPVALPNYAAPTWPAHYDAAVAAQTNAPADNPVTDAGATLGRVLFHDRKLSINDNISCAGCHQQTIGLTDTARFSAGFNTVDRTSAHSMRLGNLRFGAPAMFWDRRAATVELQVTQPIRDPVEMGFDPAHGGIDALITKMSRLPYYPELFRIAFGDSVITESRMQRALAQYVRSIVSTDSRFDRAFAAFYNPALGDRGVSRDFITFTSQENRGKTLFLTPPNQGGGGCVACHVIPTFALPAAIRSNGLDAGETRLFKSPSLKNVGVTGPYMHDGRFATLEQVVEHYVSGVRAGPALDNRLRLPSGEPVRLALSPADKAALVAFMRTLTDSTLAADARFSSPFRP